MRLVSRIAAFVTLASLIAVPLVVLSGTARAQCAAMPGCGGSHGASHEGHAKKTSAKKQRDSIARLMADEQGRALLVEALLADRAFMRSFLAQALEVPEWRAMTSQAVSEPAPHGQGGSGAEKPNTVFACPMHPEITSSKPGSCPTCGMALARRERPESGR